MTTAQTIKTLRKAGKPVSLTHLYRLFSDLGIKPLGRSRPQQYPQDTAARILAHLGFSTERVEQGKKLTDGELQRVGDGGCEVPPRSAGKLISVRALRAAKLQHKTKGTK